MEETQKSIGTTPRCFLKSGHFYFGLTTPSLSFDIAVNQEYIRLEDWIRHGIIIAKLDNIANPELSRGLMIPLSVKESSMFEKIGLTILSAVFILGGIMYIIWGGPEGEVLPIPQIRASLGYRILLGSACITAGAMAFWELKRKKTSRRNRN